MNTISTEIVWFLNDFCKSECTYCPVTLRGGGEPPETKEYLRIANLLIDTYKSMGREIKWVIDGGEPLDIDDIVILLKLFRTNGSHLTLTTNGGKLWLDWWAIEPYVDSLNLSFHYWQNPKLITYIIQTFQKKNKPINIIAPVRPEAFDEDIARIKELEADNNIKINKGVLYHYANQGAGMLGYTTDQLYIMSGLTPRKPPPPILKPKPQPKLVDIPVVVSPPVEPEEPPPPLVQEQIDLKTVSWVDRHQKIINANPSFTGQTCNVGIEKLVISHQGWVSGSDCNNQPLGNIWHPGWVPPNAPQVCTMQACISASDRKITKFSLPSH